MNQQDATRIKELGLDALKNPNPNLRKEALLELRNYDTSLINDVLERVIQKDRDKEVRDLAQNLLTKRQLQDAQRPSKPTTSSKPPVTPKGSNASWTCSFCGSETTDSHRCPNCGAERQAAHNLVAAKTAVDVNTFLLNPAHRDYVLGKSSSLSHATYR